jgi:hypothetical protein
MLNNKRVNPMNIPGILESCWISLFFTNKIGDFLGYSWDLMGCITNQHGPNNVGHLAGLLETKKN